MHGFGIQTRNHLPETLVKAKAEADITFVPEARQKSYTMTDAVFTRKSVDDG